jgi:hypothetical protein
VSEVGRQQRQAGGDIAAVAIPVDQRANSEGMAQIMRAP